MAPRWIPLLLLAILLGGCSRGSALQAQPTDTTPVVLLGSAPGRVGQVVWSKDSFPIALPDHWVVLKGTLGVNEAGCITIGRAVLWAPQGSHLIDGGSGISIPQRGTFHIGDEVQLIGSDDQYKSSTTADRVASRCAHGASTMEVANLYRARDTPSA
jgi:hypothetical protein